MSRVSASGPIKVCPMCNAQYLGGEVFCPIDASRLIEAADMPSRPDAADPLVGLTLGGRYKIRHRIGEGGMGIVYEAQHVVIEKRVALKVLRDDFSSRPEVVERFRQEAKSASRIGHQHIVDISDFGQTPTGQSYFVMEYLEGEDLANVLARESTIPVQRAASIAVQCCRALGAAHAKGIVHRDMKPENVFLTVRDGERDFVKIVDFGIAKMSDIETPGAPGRKLTKTGMIFGTPEYMSPEQAAGKPLDHRVDVYAVGVILYEILAGRVPFVGDSFMGVLTQHMFDAVPKLRQFNPQVVCPLELEMVIYRALEKDLSRRYQDMRELGRAILGAVAMPGRTWDDDTWSGYGDPSPGSGRSARVVEVAPTVEGQTPDPSGEATGVRSRRRGPILAGAGVVLLAAIGAGAYALLSAPEPRPVVAALPPRQPVVEPSVEPPVPSVAPAAAPVMVLSPPAEFTLEVRTEPVGARVSVEGRGVVCEATPCTFATPPGQPIQIRAVLGRASAERAITPDASTRLVDLPLGPERPPRRPRPRGPDPRHPSDLKIPDLFQKRPPR